MTYSKGQYTEKDDDGNEKEWWTVFSDVSMCHVIFSESEDHVDQLVRDLNSGKELTREKNEE